MPSDREVGGDDRSGIRLDVDWLLSRVITLMVGLMALALIGQQYPRYWLFIFWSAAMASHLVQRSVSLEHREDGREELVFNWPWGDSEEE